MNTRNTHQIGRLGRGEQGRISQSCRCEHHQHWKDLLLNEPVQIISIKKKKGKSFKKSLELKLRECKILPERANFICTACIAGATQMFMENADEVEVRANTSKGCASYSTDTTGDKSKLLNAVSELTDLLTAVPHDDLQDLEKNSVFEQLIPLLCSRMPNLVISGMTQFFSNASEEKLNELNNGSVDSFLHGIGHHYIKNKILDDISNVSTLYRSPEYLKDFNTRQFIDERNSAVVSFLTGVTGLNLDCESEKVRYSFACALEYVYYLRNLNIVMPHCFLSNLIQSYTSGSKTVPVINGKTSPGGSYGTLQGWLAERGKCELQCPGGDIETFFDNIGRYIPKSYRISSASYKKPLIFTTGIHIVLNTEENLQKREDLKPINWPCNNPQPGQEDNANEKVLQTMINKVEESNLSFQFVRACFIDKIIKCVQKEGPEIDNCISQHMRVDQRICTNKECLAEYDRIKYKCDLCKSPVQKVSPLSMSKPASSADTAKYTISINVEEKPNKKPTFMVDPIFKNPSSYENITLILEELKIRLGIGNERQWSFVGCDGPPYVIASRLADKDPQKYDWLVMTCGLGHLYMNQMKTFFKVAESIVLEPLAKEILHFESPKALQYFFNCSDTHKTYQALEVFFYGASFELIKHYLEQPQCDRTVEGFLSWNPSETIHLMKQLVFTYALAILVQKVGDRNNDQKIHEAGRFKFMELFYGFNHPIYQEIEFRDLKQKAVMPEPVSTLKAENLAYSISNNRAKHQGGDFVLEGKVKRQKMLASKGVDTESMWRQVSRCLDDMIEISENTNTKLRIYSDDGDRHIDLYEEIVLWRALLRHSNYFGKHTESDCAHNIYGERLSEDMLDLSAKLKEKRNDYFQQMLTYGEFDRRSFQPINVKPDEELLNMLWFDPEE